MVVVPGLTVNYPVGSASSSGLRLLPGSQISGLTRKEKYPGEFSSFRYSRRKLGCFNTRNLHEKHTVVAVGRSSYELSSESDLSPEEPFWLALIKELIWSLKSLFSFLHEQPSQLKYIEWPGFQSTETRRTWRKREPRV